MAVDKSVLLGNGYTHVVPNVLVSKVMVIEKIDANDVTEGFYVGRLMYRCIDGEWIQYPYDSMSGAFDKQETAQELLDLLIEIDGESELYRLTSTPERAKMCPHGKSFSDYCMPCGRIHNG